MKHAAIPTLYKGIQFRSRLEARWAAYFDLWSMDWKYEPIDLPGYIPDFICSAGPFREDLFEVKPASSPADCLDAAAKIDASGWRGAAVVVGRDPSIMLVSVGAGKWRPSTSMDGPAWGKWAEAGNLTQYKSRSR